MKFTTGHLVQAYAVLEVDADADTEIALDNNDPIQFTTRAGRQSFITTDTEGFANGSLTVKPGQATITHLKLVERLYPFDVAGSFKSSDELLNKLWALCARSCQVLSEDAYVDCADRERVEWMDSDPPGFDITRTALAVPARPVTRPTPTPDCSAPCSAALRSPCNPRAG